jgi:hypothetical protein
MAEDTIEWGDKRPAARRGWLARLTAEPPGDGGAADQSRRLNYPGLVLTVLGFLAVLAGQYLPWLHVNVVLGNGAPTGDVVFSAMYGTPTLTYGMSMLLVLAGVATVLAGPGPAVRRSVAAATLGLLGGQLAVLVSLAAGLGDGVGANVPIDTSGLPDGAVSLGPGYLLAVAAVGLLVAAVIVSARSGRSRRTPERQPENATVEEPIDLVVTPLPSETVDIRSERPPFGG